MNIAKLDKIEAELKEARRNCSGGMKSRQLRSFAKRLGRERKSGGTNEPTFVRKYEPALAPPLSIPGHTMVKGGTARSVISALLDDVDQWRQYLDQHGEMEVDEDESDDEDDDIGDES